MIEANNSEWENNNNGVRNIVSNLNSFAALKDDGTEMTWGTKFSGGNSSSVQNELTYVRKIIPSKRAYAALREDGSVISWGYFDGEVYIQDFSINNVKDIASTDHAFAALREDGSVFTWGTGANFKREELPADHQLQNKTFNGQNPESFYLTDS